MKSSRALVAGCALLLVALCLSTHLPVAAGKPGSKGTKAKGAGKRKLSLSEVVETVSSIKRGPGPDAPPKTRKDGDAKPARPSKGAQPSSEDFGVIASAGRGQSSAADPSGRRLLDLGDPCSVIVKNACRSRKAFQAAFGYYTYDGVENGIPGWEAVGWYNIGYGRTYRFKASQVLYVLTLNGLKPTRTYGKQAAFCVSRRPFWILMGDDDYFYKYDDDDGVFYGPYYTCAAAGGYYRGGFWAPALCGQTLTYQAC